MVPGRGILSRPAWVAFDVIETLFSLEGLRPRLEAAGLPGASLDTWFASTLRDAFALAAIGAFQPLQAMQETALVALSRKHGVALDEGQRETILAGMQELDPHPDVGAAMACLAAAGLSVMAVSNGSAAATEALLQRAGLRPLVSLVLSVDEVRLSKPRPEIYRYATQRAGIDPAQMILVATHPWDVNGAKAASLMGGFVARGQAYPSTMTPPDFEGETLAEIAAAIAILPLTE